MKRYNDFSSHMKSVFGTKAAKLLINGGFSCPNRIEGKGCLFCSDSGYFSGGSDGSVSSQISDQIKVIVKKWPTCIYIAYFGTNTSTYGDIPKLKKLFDEALSHEDVKALAISTRPDCLDDDVLELLTYYNQKYYVWVELGLQSIHSKTHDLVNTGYDYDIFQIAFKKLNMRGIRTVVHLIFGLPYETKDMMMKSAKAIGELQPWGIKFHMLYILTHSPLYEFYKKHPFDILSMDEYADLITKALEYIPEECVIHRLTGDAPRKYLYKPEWSVNKHKVLQLISKKQFEADSFQGKLACDRIQYET